MKKKLEMWLASIIRTELSRTEALAIERAGRLETSIAALSGETKAHTKKVASELYENVSSHAEKIAANLHAKVAADAKIIAEFRRSVRMPCSLCGQMVWDYAVKREAGKIICLDCKNGGRN